LSKSRRASSDGTRHEIYGKVTINCLDHLRVHVAQSLCDDLQRHAVHDREACPRMSQAVKGDGRIELGAFARDHDEMSLVGRTPRHCVGPGEHRRVCRPTAAYICKEILALGSQDHVAGALRFRFPDQDRAGSGIKVADLEAPQLATSAAVSSAARAKGLNTGSQALRNCTASAMVR
jgi:hypothetical protein